MSLSKDGTLDESDFPYYFLRHAKKDSVLQQHPQPLVTEVPNKNEKGLTELVNEYEKSILWETYQACGKNVTKAAAKLHLSRQNFQYHLRKFGIKEEKE